MEVTGTKARATRVRVYASGSYTILVPARIATAVEDTMGTAGSSIQQQTGRWHGKQEEGFVVECVSDKYGYPGDSENINVLMQLEPVLQYLTAETGLTFYVTAEPVWAMEIF